MIRRVASALLLALSLSACTGAAPGSAPASPLHGVRYSSSGGIQGGHHSIELTVDDAGSPVVVASDQEWHNSREITSTFAAPADILEQINAIVADYGLTTASTRPDSGLYPLDGDIWSLSFDYGEESFAIGQLQETSDKENEGVRKVLELMGACCDAEPLSTAFSQRELRLSTSEGYTFFLRIEDTALADSLVAQLPASVVLEPYSTNELVFQPPQKLYVSGAQSAPAGGAGTLAYYEPWNNVVLFIDDYEEAEDLYILGSFDASDASYLAEHTGEQCTLMLETHM